jgi:uncharacterized membrane protein
MEPGAMTAYATSLLALIAALGTALIAGVFFAFSTFVMRALRRLPTAQGLLAMQSINVVVLNPWFLGVFLGTAVVCALCSCLTVIRWTLPGSVFLLAGSALYLAGTVAATLLANVPRNEALAVLAPDNPQAASRWAQYIRDWTAWNRVRTAAALAAATAFILARA